MKFKHDSALQDHFQLFSIAKHFNPVYINVTFTRSQRKPVEYNNNFSDTECSIEKNRYVGHIQFYVCILTRN